MVFAFSGAKNPEQAIGRKQVAGSQSKPIIKNGHKNLAEFIKIYKPRRR